MADTSLLNISNEELLELKQSGKSYQQIADELDAPYNLIRMRIRRAKRKQQAPTAQAPTDQDHTHKVFEFIKDRERTLTEICNHIDRSPAYVEALIAGMESRGFTIERNRQLVKVNASLPNKGEPVETLADNGGNEFAFAVPSDLHSGSKLQQITALRRFCDIARTEYGVKDFVVPGDISAGYRVYRGQENEVYALGPDEQEKALQLTVPIEPDDKWYIMGGNHDWSHVRNYGRDIVKNFCKQYPNVKYLGYSQYDLPLTDKVNARLWHPRGGVPYAKSYRAQKGVEALVPEILKDSIRDGRPAGSWFLLVGHLHIAHFMPGLEICGAQVGCFEGQTMWMKEGALWPAIGGWIFRVRATDSGLLHRVIPEFVAFDPIIDDWKNYPELQFERDFSADAMEPIFKGSGEYKE